MIAKRTTAACIVVATALTAVAAASPAAPKQRMDVTAQKGSPTHLAGVPPEGVKASTPTTGKLMLGVISQPPRPTTTLTTIWRVYTDGRIIWQRWSSSGEATVVPGGARRTDTGYVQQRLTLRGVQLLRSKILATGLFEHDLKLEVGGHKWLYYQARRGDRLVTVRGLPSAAPTATPAQMRELAWIEKLVAHPDRRLPANVWADRQIRAFVPARYVLAVDRDYPDLSKLPAPARRVFVQYKKLRRHACQILTTGQARALLRTFVEAGISPSENNALTIAFSLAGLRNPSDLHLTPALPDTRC